jgi:hypothetical protein
MRWTDSCEPRADWWERREGDLIKVVYLSWDVPRPRFTLLWFSEAVDQELGYSAEFRVAPWRVGQRDGIWCGYYFGGFSSVDRTVSVTLRRVTELLAYLDGGEPTRYLGLERPSKGRHYDAEWRRAFEERFPDGAGTSEIATAWGREFEESRKSATGFVWPRVPPPG